MTERGHSSQKLASRVKRDYVQFRAPPAWIANVQEAAGKLCLSVSAFVRLAVIEKMSRLRQNKEE